MNPTPAKKPLPPKGGGSSYSGSSWDDDITNLVMIILGQYGAGKTTLAATIDPACPFPLPTTKHKGPPKFHLKKVFWLPYDKGAILSFKERGIAVNRFDIRKYMAEKKASVMQATEIGLVEAEKAVDAGAEWIVVDTVSTFDKMLDVYWQAALLADKGLKDSNTDKSANKLIEEIQIPKYGRMFTCHKMLHDNLMRLGCGVIYLTHAKANIDLGLGSADDKDKIKKVKQTMSTAAGGILAPDITGKGAGVYKADARLQLVVKVVPNMQGKLVREVWAEPRDGYETKNSWELSIQGKQEANLRAILEKIQ